MMLQLLTADSALRGAWAAIITCLARMSDCAGIHICPAAAHHADHTLSAIPDRPPLWHTVSAAAHSHSACSFTRC
jgi:hypothetical protein